MKLWRSVVNECIPGSGDALLGRAPSLGWCAEITGTDPKFRFRREFVRPMSDHSESSGNGNRGVLRCFLLKEGSVYEVFERLSWKMSRRYFCRVVNGTLVTLDLSYVEALFQ